MKKSEQVSEKIPTANRQYKDTVFRMLFSEKENLLSLYNAVTGSHYQNAEALKIVTLENAIYMGMKNDLAFMLETNIYLYEHQSTINPNIPLRDLIYIGIEYQQFVNDKSLYSSKLQKIPAPKFMVFYNGTDDVEDRMELKLSSAYEHLAGEPDLELKVLMLNVNEGHNKELMEQCQTLKEYAIYVARVRKYASELNLNDAVERAITECIKEGILVEFLRKNRSEVKMVSILEYDKEWEEKKLRKAEYEAGKEDGRNEGIEIGKNEGIEIGKNEGIKIGKEIGKSKGIEIGREEAIAEMIHNMAKCGYSIDKIAEITGRSTEQIQSIMDR
ncbi:hypothetical protein DXA60_18235 [Roseburia sp. OF03-24]|jgi:hypothetical protein|uniref:hypothetical protein n=1 Tax=Roseburia sp. OF03-24 TaxID=2292367 RepID=UPI000E46A9F4|nr:hypothetical protein [Roseburia sp. OF03-24]RGX89121.1 hypothetical protein DXA60_18235 [Roseburia sp. OF03-24]